MIIDIVEVRLPLSCVTRFVWVYTYRVTSYSVKNASFFLNLMYLNIYQLFPASKKFSAVYLLLHNQPPVNLSLGQYLCNNFLWRTHLSRVGLHSLIKCRKIYQLQWFDWKCCILLCNYCNTNESKNDIRYCNHEEVFKYLMSIENSARVDDQDLTASCNWNENFNKQMNPLLNKNLWLYLYFKREVKFLLLQDLKNC